MATQRIGGRAEKEPEPTRQDRPFLLVDRATWLVLPDELHGRGNWRDHTLHFSSKRVIVIQAKIGPVGMFYLSQKARVGQGLDTLCHTHLFSIERSQEYCTRSHASGSLIKTANRISERPPQGGLLMTQSGHRMGLIRGIP